MNRCIPLVILLFAAGPAFGTLLGLPNDCVNGDFESGVLDPWYVASGSVDGITAGDAFGPPSPNGGNKCGSVASWGTKSGVIEQYFENPEPDEWEKDIAVGAWVYAHSFDGSGNPNDSANIRLSVHIGGADYYTDWIHTGDQWVWAELQVLGVPCYDFIVDVEFQHQAAVAWNVTYVDGVDVEHICVPEPGAAGLLLLAGVPLLMRRRR